MHYLKINDSDKKKIGYLIHLYRTQQFKHLSQNSFLLNEYNEPICTRQTLSKIEQGIIIKNDSIYEELLKKVNLNSIQIIVLKNSYQLPFFSIY